jgi:tetratricopeptide (TPR) repeat protein
MAEPGDHEVRANHDHGATAVDPDRLATLEEERTFLLRSLRDLDAEHAAGDVDEHDYAALRDGYTKRAADVLREIDEGRARLPSRSPTSWARRLGVGVAIVAVAVGAGWLVARSSGDRLAGEEVSGGVPRDDVASMLAEARLLRATDPAAAMQLYGAVLEQRPEHAEALTYSGWLLLFVANQSSDAALVDEAVAGAREKLAAAIDADPRYPDPHCYLAIIAAEHDDDVEAARSQAESCLDLDPPADLRAEIEQFLTTLS